MSTTRSTSGITDLAEIYLLPKAELHVHLEGSVDLPTINAIARRKGLTEVPPERFSFHDFEEFKALFMFVLSFLTEKEDFYEISLAFAERQSRDHVVYTETFLVPFFHLSRGIQAESFLDGIEAGLAEGERRFGTTVNLIFSIPRTFDEEAGMRTLELIEGYGGSRVVAIDLSGMESGRDVKRFAEIFREAHQMGLATVAHAGEFTPSRRIHETIDILGVQRIGHGISAWGDETLIRRLAKEGIALEVAVTSNVRLDAVPSLAEHPVRRLYDEGVPIVINTDDPALFSTTLNQEYALLAKEFGFTARELHRLIDNSFAYAFLDDETRVRLMTRTRQP